MPVFGPLQIKEMMEEMRDIASQLLLKVCRLHIFISAFTEYLTLVGTVSRASFFSGSA
jgi:hypothetical protein